jgi:hypothetical protein
MNSNDSAPEHNPSREEVISALFANLVIQQTNMAFMFLGRVPHPETGEVMRDLESAKFFIDQLEMVEVKTKGNLDNREEALLKQSLTGLRMAFVEAINEKEPAPGQASPTPTDSEPAKSTEAAPRAEAAPEPKAASDDESRKKFSKKY